MKARSLGLVVLALCSASLDSRQASSPPAGNGMIAGALVSADRGEPIRRAQVRLSSASPRTTQTTTTDQDGRFVFEQLPAADYTLTASRAGFLDMAYGARRPGGPSVPGRTITLAAGQKVANVSFALHRGGVITGTVFDEFGDPSYRTAVRALKFAYMNGERTLAQAGTGTTDDRGQFRIPGLLPGEYLVAATPSDAVAITSSAVESLRMRQLEVIAAARAANDTSRVAELERQMRDMPTPLPPNPVGYVPAYYPGTPQPSAAAPVRVGLSEEVSGIDLRLQVLQTATVTGTVMSAEPLPAEVNVMLLDPRLPASQVGVWFRTVGRDGRFTFHGVVPGQYVLRARAGMPQSAPGGPGEMTTAMTVIVDPAQPADHVLRLERGVNVTGQLVLDTLRGVADPTRLTVELYPVSSAADWEMPIWRVPADAAGRFVARGVVPGRFRIGVRGLPAGFSVASAMFGGRDAADYLLTVEPGGSYDGMIRFTDRLAEVSGVLTTATGAPTSEPTVILFPDDRDLWIPASRRIQVLRPDADGKFVARSLPAGDYRLAAVVDPEPNSWFDRDVLASLVPGAVAITLADGERKTQDLRVR